MGRNKKTPSTSAGDPEVENNNASFSSDEFEESDDSMDVSDHEDEPKEQSEDEKGGGGGGGGNPVASETRHSLKPMERRKKRKALDKDRHRAEPKSDDISKRLRMSTEEEAAPPVQSSQSGLPELHLGAFMDLSSAESSVRRAAAEALASELAEIQSAYERLGDKGKGGNGAVQLEAEKDDGLEECAPSLKYALRRLIRGVASPRECARQGFALGLTAVLITVPMIKIDSIMKLIVGLVEISSSMKGQEARDSYLGRMFAYGALARSGRISGAWMFDNKTCCLEEFISQVIYLAGKKRYLQEPAATVILDLASKLPVEAISKHLLQVQSLRQWFDKAVSDKNPDALFVALKLQERVSLDSDALGGLLLQPFSSSGFFSREHLSSLVPCFQESTFCQPRVHSIWPVLVNILLSDVVSQEEDAAMHSMSTKKHKKSKKGSSEDAAKNIQCFIEVVIEGSLLASSHDRKHLAFDILLLLLPKLPPSCIHIILSYKLVHCLMDILSTMGSWLYNAAQHFLKEIVNWVGNDDDRLVAAVVSLQKHSNGRFDCITRTHTVKELVAKLNTGSGCILFVHSLINLFVEEGDTLDELSDQSQTTDENSEKGSLEDSALIQGNADFLKSWVIDTLPRVLKNLKLGSEAKIWAPSEIIKFLESKFRVQTEIMKFLAVQGLFSASLGTEVTSFELQEKFKWPKVASSTSLRRLCIEQLQFLMEDAQRGDGSDLSPNELESNDLGSYFICFLSTLCNIPSVTLFRTLSIEDEKSFKKLQTVETRLFQEERKLGHGPDASKLHAMRYLLIQLLLQVLLRPGEFSEAASELIICCKKAFPGFFQSESLEVEDHSEGDDSGSPDMIDVLVDTLLSLLPQSSGPMCYTVEQVFRFFCNEITNTGLLRMLRVIKKDLKPLRHHADETDDDDEDDDEDFLGVEDAEDTSEIEAAETADSDGEADNEGKLEPETNNGDDDEMDDEAMFRMDSYITQFLKKSGKSGNDSATAQLMLFKLRVLQLLEIYLQRNPGKPQVFTIYSYLTRAFVNYHSAEGSKQLGERIGGILQKKIFKAKEYPRDTEIEISSLETLLEKSLKSASRARIKSVSSLAQNSAFWILKITQSRNFTESELEGVMKILKQIVVDYFDSKKCRLKSDFLKEILRRYPWAGRQLFGFFLEKCASAKSEFRRVEALDLIDCIMKLCISTSKGDTKKDKSRKSKFLKGNLAQLCELIQQLLIKLPENKSRRAGIRRFCARAFEIISALKLTDSFLKSLKPDAQSLCESQLGDLFHTFRNSKRGD